jgi:Domain of unknown function (DUF7014)
VSFTERNIAPRTPAGPTVPSGARRSLLTWFTARGLNASLLWEAFLQQEGYGTWDDIEDDIRTRFGDEEADAWTEAIEQHLRRERQRIVRAAAINYDAEPALLSLPSLLFLDVLEYALKREGSGRNLESMNEINRLFTKLGVSFQFGYNGQTEWHGDPGAYETVIGPALDALTDPRLAGCRSEFEAAIGHLRAGTAKDREDAIEEAGKAVESAMKVLLTEHGAPLTDRETANPLFQALVDQGVCVQEADKAVLGSSRLRNQYGGHGTGAQVRVVPPGVPELAVQSTATAINYLASLLP